MKGRFFYWLSDMLYTVAYRIETKALLTGRRKGRNRKPTGVRTQ